MLRACTVLLLLSCWLTPAFSQAPKKPEKKPEPKMLLAHPLGAALNSTTKITLRGLHLDTATEVKLSDPAIAVKILSKGKAAVPDKNPEKVGDTQVVLEVKLPATLGAPPTFTVHTPHGATLPHPLLVEMALPVVSEKETNDGFKNAQPLALPCVVEGSIQQQRDVDVFRVEGTAGQRLLVEVLAARHGSALDAMLLLYDAQGQQLAAAEGSTAQRDPRLEMVLPRSGVYYLALLDANDMGGVTHPYRLLVKSVK